jgi:hypothetical protein
MARSSTCCCPCGAAARRFFTQAMGAGTVPVEVTTDRAPVYPRVLDELAPSALRTFEQYANNPIEADHGRLKARLRPMRGLKRHSSARILAAAMPSCRTCAAATTTSPPTSPTTTGSASPSKTSPPPSDQRSIPIMLRRSLGMTQRNSAN